MTRALAVAILLCAVVPDAAQADNPGHDRPTVQPSYRELKLALAAVNA